MQTWKTLSKDTSLDRGKFLRVEDHTVQLPDGRVIEKWPWIITPDFINLLPVTAAGNFLVFRQLKYGLDGLTLAPVGGYIEPGEGPLAAAERELMEETGHVATELIPLGNFRVDPNRGAGTGYLYLALGTRKAGKITADDLEEQEIVYLDLEELKAALFAGEFKALSWTTTVSLALQHIAEAGVELGDGES
ncbi:MAG: NUDIX hydrolase [Anaerolineales bacterium]|nr:NUDIX hydrolase [Anaerolineales bacterium]